VKKTFCFALALCWTYSLASKAALTVTDAPSVINVEEIHVSASRQNASAFDLPYTLQVLSEQQLRQQQIRNLPEALVNQPGVLIQKTANGQGSPFIRGFTGYRTLTLIDGIRYNNSVYRDGPNEYFSLIDAFALEQIELLSGPASGLYGSDAVGGVLNLNSKSSRFNQQPLGDNYQLGSQGYRYSTAEHSNISRTEIEVGVGQYWGLRLGYSYKHFGDVQAAQLGTQPHTGYDERAYDLRFDTQLSEQWTLTLLHQNLDQEDVWRTHSTVFALPFAGTEIGTDQKRLKDQQRRLSSVKVTASDLTDWIDTAVVTVSEQRWFEYEHRIQDSGEFLLQGFDSTMHGLDLALTSRTATIDWHYGFDVYRDNVDSWRSDYYADGSLERVRIQGPIGDDSRFDVSGVYAQADWLLSENQRLLFSTRYNRTRAEVGQYEDPVSAQPARFNDQWSRWASAVRYSFAFDTDTTARRFWMGLGQSFRAPNIADLSRFGQSRSNETEIAATQLEPELFLTYELGMKWHTTTRVAQISYYYTRIRDFIASTPTGQKINGLTEVSKQNAAEGFIEGIELQAEQQLSDRWLLKANATWLAGELDSPTGDREPYSRIMPPQINLTLQWQLPSYNTDLSLLYTHSTTANKLSTADKQDLQRIPPGGTPAYNLWHLRSYFQYSEKLSIHLALDNLLDEAYRNHGSGSNEPGRNLIVGFNYDF
jgi:outer membrane receptor protein involved in Fe transport